MLKHVETVPFAVEEEQLLHLAQKYAQTIGTIFLHSGRGYEGHNVSYLALYPHRVIEVPADHKDPWHKLRNELTFSSSSCEGLPKYLGFLSYEMGAYSRCCPHVSAYTPPHALSWFVEPSLLFRWQRSSKKLELFVHASCHLTEAAALLVDRVKKEEWAFLFAPLLDESFHVDACSLVDSYSSYCQNFERLKEYLRAGDVYQLCLSRCLKISYSGLPFGWFKSLMQHAPTPFGAFLALPKGHILSLSPECFLTKQEKLVETQPIKGTARRKVDPIEDLKVRDALIASEKNNSELVMITDLMRNDLSRVCQVGSVQVLEERRCDAYPYLWHLSSKVQGKLQEADEGINVLESCFPPGSISGCPKQRALQIIYDLEKQARGIYTGAIGYFTESGDFDFNVAIRSFYAESGEAYIRSGGAILASSNLQQEWEETWTKYQGLLHPVCRGIDVPFS